MRTKLYAMFHRQWFYCYKVNNSNLLCQKHSGRWLAEYKYSRSLLNIRHRPLLAPSSDRGGADILSLGGDSASDTQAGFGLQSLKELLQKFYISIWSLDK